MAWKPHVLKSRREAGGEALACLADVTDAAQVEAAAAAVHDRFGALDIWINNAMVSVFSPVAEMTAASYLHGHSGLLRASSRHSRRQGAIVDRASDAGHGSAPLLVGPARGPVLPAVTSRRTSARGPWSERWSAGVMRPR
jgi:NAD(P)-dependent dehydrogenase (short-subunit alcohol dehydrogenase family)